MACLAMIGWSMIGAHLSVFIVRLVVIGYHCNHFGGQLNYQAFTYWLISGLLTIDFAISNLWHGTAHLVIMNMRDIMI